MGQISKYLYNMKKWSPIMRFSIKDSSFSQTFLNSVYKMFCKIGKLNQTRITGQHFPIYNKVRDLKTIKYTISWIQPVIKFLLHQDLCRSKTKKRSRNYNSSINWSINFPITNEIIFFYYEILQITSFYAEYTQSKNLQNHFYHHWPIEKRIDFKSILYFSNYE